MKKVKYIYLFKRVSHDQAKLIVKKKMWNAEKIEKRLHQYFHKSRFTLTDKINKRRWVQSHVKIGISQDVDRRLKDVNRNIFKSGSTEWFAMHFIEQLIVHALIRWYAYRWVLLIALVAFIWYGNSLK